MASRAGMIALINKLRSLCNAGREDYAIDGVDHWSDDHLEAILDSNVTHIEDTQLTWLPDTTAGGTVSWTRAMVPYRDTEGTVSGTSYWVLRDGTGTVITASTATYSVNHDDGMVRFVADRGGTAYYLTGRSYDVHSAAADVWGRKAAYYAEWYDFGSDSQNFARHQAYDQAVKMEQDMRQRAGQNKQRGSLQTGVFQRIDVTAW